MLPGRNIRIEQLCAGCGASMIFHRLTGLDARMVVLTKWWLIAHVDIDGHLNFGGQSEHGWRRYAATPLYFTPHNKTACA